MGKAMVAVMAVASAMTMTAGEIKVDFARDKWDKSAWMLFKSPRFGFFKDFVQMDDHLVNPSDSAWSDEELYSKHVTEVYASMVHRQKFAGMVEISSTMSFDHLMAPLIVITRDLPKNDAGQYEFREHYEVVLYNEGLNVWHHTYENGQAKWHLAAFARTLFEPKRKYELKVRMFTPKGRDQVRMTVECGDVRFGFEDPDLPGEFYAGITGCEGRNRFYDFKVRCQEGSYDPAKDGEH